jgi:hypothetical protein
MSVDTHSPTFSRPCEQQEGAAGLSKAPEPTLLGTSKRDLIDGQAHITYQTACKPAQCCSMLDT